MNKAEDAGVLEELGEDCVFSTSAGRAHRWYRTVFTERLTSIVNAAALQKFFSMLREVRIGASLAFYCLVQRLVDEHPLLPLI